MQRQAFVNKHTNASNQSSFAPDALRDLAPSEKLGAETAMYVKLEGLGKIAYSNLRRPRPLMDLVAEPEARKSESQASCKHLCFTKANSHATHDVLWLAHYQ